MIRDRKGQGRLCNLGGALMQSGKSVEGTFVHEMAIHPKQGFAVVTAHDLVRVPQFVEQGPGCPHAFAPPCDFLPYCRR